MKPLFAAEEGVGIILTPARPFPEIWEGRRMYDF